MKQKLLALFALVLHLSVFAQTPQYAWSGIIPTEKYYSHGVRCNSLNEVYNFGTFIGTVDFDPGPAQYTVAANGTMSFLMKLNQQGALVWVKTFKAFPVDLTFDLNGAPVLSAGFIGTVDLDPGPGTQIFTSGGPYNACLLKLDNNGNFIWAKQFAGNSFCDAVAVTCDQTGNILITGNYNGSIDFDPGAGTANFYQGGSVFTAGFVCKLDSNGNYLWARNFSSIAMGGTDIVTDRTGNVYFTGSFADSVDFDPGPGEFYLWQKQFQIFACKLTSSGDFIWAGQFGGYAADRPGKIALDSKNNMYISGFLKGAGDVDPGAAVVTIPTGNKWVPGFVCKLDSSGNFITVLSSGLAGNSAEDIAIDAADNLYIAGLYVDSTDLDGGPGTLTLATKGTTDVFVSKHNPSLQPVWAGTFMGDADAYPSLAVDRYQNIFVQGLFTDSLDCNPASPVNYLTTGTVSTGYCIKLASGLQPPPSSVNLSEERTSPIQFYPNPTTGLVHLSSTTGFIEKIVVYDLFGRSYPHHLKDNCINISSYPNGVYFLEMSTNAGFSRLRIVKY